jgi:hypothetical protein
MTNGFDSRILRGDTSIFTIFTSMSQSDKSIFLELLNIVGGLHPGYTYLEVGSERGGSIIAPLVDSRCGTPISVDLRSDSQPDERGSSFSFPENTTDKMLETLASVGVSEEALGRLRTFDTDIGMLPFERIGTRAHIAFIDAEHTNQAVFRDYLNVSRFMECDSIIAFHDANLVFDGLVNIQAMLRHQGVCYSAHYLPDVIFVLAFGAMAGEVSRTFATRSLDAAHFVATSRAALNAEIVRSVSRRYWAQCACADYTDRLSIFGLLKEPNYATLDAPPSIRGQPGPGGALA